VIERVPHLLTGEATIVTTSEHFILTAQKMVRDRKIRPEDLMLVEHGRYPKPRRCGVDEQGDFADDISPFFNERLSLLR
jgi:hypothetical protein